MILDREKHKVGNYIIFGQPTKCNYFQALELAKTADLFDQIKSNEIAVEVSWRGQAYVGYKNISDLLDGHEVICVN